MYSELIFNLGIVVGTSLVIYILVALSGWGLKLLVSKYSEEEVNIQALYIGYAAALPFGISAMVLGYLSGFSFEPAASALVTGVISLISGAAFIIFTQDLKALMPVGIVIVVFALNLLSGATLGSNLRDEALAVTKEEADTLKSELLQNALIEFSVNNYRKNLGLPPLRLESRFESPEQADQ